MWRVWAWLAARTTGRPSAAEAQRDPWRRLPLEPPLSAFGPGADSFRQYLTGTSRVPVEWPEDIAGFLRGCQYVSDPDLHGEVDAWLHPLTLELVRAGDCEDFALWAWRKFIELDFAAHFVVGMRRRADGQMARHAWVVYPQGPDDMLFDAVESSVDRIMRPLDDARDEYLPQVGVTPVAMRYAYAGLFASRWGRSVRLRRLDEIRSR
ncbi:MAG: hypothetical protein U0163_06295 [Gemmatimonadaceae bacterium]